MRADSSPLLSGCDHHGQYANDLLVWLLLTPVDNTANGISAPIPASSGPTTAHASAEAGPFLQPLTLQGGENVTPDQSTPSGRSDRRGPGGEVTGRNRSMAGIRGTIMTSWFTRDGWRPVHRA